MHEATFVGGPFDGDTYTVRSETAVYAVDEPAGLIWKYTPLSGGDFSTYHLNYLGGAGLETGARPYDEQALIQAVEDGAQPLGDRGEHGLRQVLNFGHTVAHGRGGEQEGSGSSGSPHAYRLRGRRAS